MFKIGDEVYEVGSLNGTEYVYDDLPAGTIEAIETDGSGEKFYFVRWDGDRQTDSWNYSTNELQGI